MSKASRLFGVVKIGPKAHMEDFYSTGRLYMNTLRFFKKNEKEDNLRHDPSEGLLASYPAAMIGFEKLKGVELHVNGPLQLDQENDEDINIFSMYGITERNLHFIVDEKALEFGDTAVVITQGPEFQKRVICECKKKGWDYSFGLVDYVDKETYSGPMGPFRKYSDRAYQSEYRIAVKANLKKPVEDFQIGDISDISCLCDSSSLREQFRVQFRRECANS